MQQLHESYDQRINMLLQQKREIMLLIQSSLDQQMEHFVGSLVAMQRGNEIAINKTEHVQEVQFRVST